MDELKQKDILERLLEFADSLPTQNLLPTLVPEAAPLVMNDPYAFAIAVCLDRGMKAEIVWTIPFYIQNDLGHLDPHQIHQMTLDELASLFNRLPKRPRYINAAPKTLKDITRIVVEECNGNAANIWNGRRAADVKRVFLSVHGVGPGIANMGVLLIEKTFNVRFNDLDRSRMDIKPDVHTVRVLHRLGVSDALTTDAAIDGARLLSPHFPGAVDGALWEIGRRFCVPTNPNCADCPMTYLCAKRL